MIILKHCITRAVPDACGIFVSQWQTIDATACIAISGLLLKEWVVTEEAERRRFQHRVAVEWQVRNGPTIIQC